MTFNLSNSNVYFVPFYSMWPGYVPPGLSPPIIQATNSVFTAVMSSGPPELSPPIIQATDSVFTAVMSSGPPELSPPIIQATDSVFTAVMPSGPPGPSHITLQTSVCDDQPATIEDDAIDITCHNFSCHNFYRFSIEEIDYIHTQKEQEIKKRLTKESVTTFPNRDIYVKTQKNVLRYLLTCRIKLEIEKNTQVYPEISINQSDYDIVTSQTSGERFIDISLANQLIIDTDQHLSENEDKEEYLKYLDGYSVFLIYVKNKVFLGSRFHNCGNTIGESVYLRSSEKLYDLLGKEKCSFELRKISSFSDLMKAEKSIDSLPDWLLTKLFNRKIDSWEGLKHGWTYENLTQSFVDMYAETTKLEYAEGKILVLQGPPGTGKSTLISNFVEKILNQPELINEKQKILLTGHSNNSVKRLFELIIEPSRTLCKKCIIICSSTSDLNNLAPLLIFDEDWTSKAQAFLTRMLNDNSRKNNNDLIDSLHIFSELLAIIMQENSQFVQSYMSQITTLQEKISKRYLDDGSSIINLNNEELDLLISILEDFKTINTESKINNGGFAEYIKYQGRLFDLLREKVFLNSHLVFSTHTSIAKGSAKTLHDTIHAVISDEASQSIECMEHLYLGALGSSFIEAKYRLNKSRIRKRNLQGDFQYQTVNNPKKIKIEKQLKQIDGEISNLESYLCNSSEPQPMGKLLLLVGDHKQLPGYCDSQSTEINSVINSLFESLIQNNKNTDKIFVPMLNLEFRMLPDIASFSNQEFYSSQLFNLKKENWPSLLESVQT